MHHNNALPEKLRKFELIYQRMIASKTMKMLLAQDNKNEIASLFVIIFV